MTPTRMRAAKGANDRFIPSRAAMNLDGARFTMENAENLASDSNVAQLVSPSKEAYTKILADNLLQGETKEARILAFKSKAPAAPEGFESSLRTMYTANAAGVKNKKQFRHIPQAPERILDAPELTDDYYLNLLDWGTTNNTVSVALGNTVYLWNAGSGDIQQLCQREDTDDIVTSVAWAADNKHIAVGTSGAEVQIWDASRAKIVRTLRGHSARVSALSWNGTTLATAGRDNNILINDVRIRDHLTNTLRGHDQEVCGLKWSPSGQQLASGANDNVLNIWDQQSISNNTWLHQLTEHQAAVKALAWCPFQSNLLASGGGTADRCIKFWNTHTGALQNSIDTHSQVCALQWNTHEREILSSHGYSQNQLCLWKYPTMVKMAEFTGHTARVLHMAQSPDGHTVVSAAADETLRFWRAFGDGADSKKAKAVSAATGSLRTINLRRVALAVPLALVPGIALTWPSRSLAAGANSFEYMPAIKDKDYGKPRTIYPDYILTDSGLQYKDLVVGTGTETSPGSICTIDWDGYTIGYYGRPFEARNKARGGAFTGDEKDYLKVELGAGKFIPAFEEGLRGMKVGGIRRLIVPPGPISYPDGALRSKGPRPSTFSGQRALDFVMENQGMIDKTLLFDIELVRVDNKRK